MAAAIVMILVCIMSELNCGYGKRPAALSRLAMADGP